MSIRPATMEDLAFIDALQKKHHKQLGFFPRAQIEGYIRNQWVLIAEGSTQRAEGSDLHTANCLPPTPLGYVASRDRYQKRDELGAIFQLCVDEHAQRKLVGAMLLKEVFERSAYGTKLYCCWCAQDIEANRFWESMGFVPLAFRAGSAKKSRVHIFWQRRIREGDTTTPWWFPFQTSGGSIREDRLVLPIPPGTHWSDAKPIILPEFRGQSSEFGKERKALDGPRTARLNSKLRTPNSRAIGAGFFRFAGEAKPPAPKGEKPPREKRVKQKNDPKFVAAARELRDRWMEKVNLDPTLLTSSGKYDLSRQLQSSADHASEQRLLDAA